MAEAAQAWLERLNEEQRGIAVGHLPADAETTANAGAGSTRLTDHGGLTVHQQRPAQQRAAMRLVAAGLSRPGYVTVATTMGLENVLDHTEGFVTRFDRERGRDPGMYYLRVFGDPERGHLGLAVRRAPRLPEQPDRRRRTGLHHAVLHGCRSGLLRTALVAR